MLDLPSIGQNMFSSYLPVLLRFVVAHKFSNGFCMLHRKGWLLQVNKTLAGVCIFMHYVVIVWGCN